MGTQIQWCLFHFLLLTLFCSVTIPIISHERKTHFCCFNISCFFFYLLKLPHVSWYFFLHLIALTPNIVSSPPPAAQLAGRTTWCASLWAPRVVCPPPAIRRCQGGQSGWDNLEKDFGGMWNRSAGENADELRWDILGNIQAPNSQSSQRALLAGSEDVPHCHPSQEDNNGRPHSRMTTSNRPEHLHSQLQLSGHGFLPEICQPAHPNTGMDDAGAALLVPLARLWWDVLSSPGAGGAAHASCCLGATTAGRPEAEGVWSEAAGDRSVEGSDRRGQGPKAGASWETEAKDFNWEARPLALFCVWSVASRNSFSSRT